jgi:glucokinase
MLLAADAGGTKTALAIYAPGAPIGQPAAESSYKSGEFDSLEELIGRFLEKSAFPVERACIAVAGPVLKGKADPVNLAWDVEEERIGKRLQLASVHLMNDLEALAWSLPILEPADLRCLNPGEKDPTGNLAVLAPGTGLGEAFLAWDGSGYHAYPSEGGHADFAPVNELQSALLGYLLEEHRHVSYERVCSGIGIPNIFRYLKDSGRGDVPVWLTEKLASADDPTPVIVEAAVDGRSAICVETLEIFVAILGAEAGNMALRTMATGGVYLGGGIPPRILPNLQGPDFLTFFQEKGRMTELMSRIPIFVITTGKAALLGAAFFGLEILKME